MLTCTRRRQTLQACYALPPPQQGCQPTPHAVSWITSHGRSTRANGRHHLRCVTPAAPWGLSRSRAATDMRLQCDSMRLSECARRNTAITLLHDPASARIAPKLTCSLGQPYAGAGKCTCRSFGKRHEAGSNAESRFYKSGS